MSLVAILDRLGVGPLDSPDLRLQKTLLVRASLFFIAAGAAWGLLYRLFAEPLARAIPLGYAIVSTLNVISIALSRRYDLFRRSQLLLILFLPFMLQLALGGFVSTSAVILWALICPFGALVYDEPRHAPYWFLGYLALVIASGFLQPYLRVTNNLSPQLILIFFVTNVATVSAFAFGLLYFFVGQMNRFYVLLRIEQQ
jgi:adenylate cyclase